MHALTAIFAGLLLLCCARPAAADYIIGEIDWDSGTTENWVSDDAIVNLSNPGAGGNPDGWLQIDFSETSQPAGSEWQALVYTDAANLFAGTWEQIMYVQFDFWAENTAPVTLQIQWGSSNSDTVWGYTLDTSDLALQTWTTYTAEFSNWDDWDIEPFTDEALFLADLAAIDWIGVYIERDGADAQMYGLDNFQLWIPEPAEYFFIAAVLLVFWREQRRRQPVSA